MPFPPPQASPSDPTVGGPCPLSSAASTGACDIIDTLLQAGATLHQSSAPTESAKADQSAMVIDDASTAAGKADIESVAECPALAAAAFHGREKAVAHLISKGAKVSTTTVCAAVLGGNLACVTALCAHVGNATLLNARGLQGVTPLSLVSNRASGPVNK